MCSGLLQGRASHDNGLLLSDAKRSRRFEEGQVPSIWGLAHAGSGLPSALRRWVHSPIPTSVAPGIVAAMFAALLACSAARAACTTSGAAPVVVTCSGTFATNNTVNTSISRTQSFNDSVAATVDSTGVITGAGLAPTSTLSGSPVRPDHHRGVPVTIKTA